jgi:hypothetical protein
MVVQVKKKVVVLDQPFLQPDAVRRIEVLEGLDGVHGSAFHLTHANQLIRPKIGFSSRTLVRMAIRGTLHCFEDFSLPIARPRTAAPSHTREGVAECRLVPLGCDILGFGLGGSPVTTRK